MLDTSSNGLVSNIIFDAVFFRILPGEMGITACVHEAGAACLLSFSNHVHSRQTAPSCQKSRAQG